MVKAVYQGREDGDWDFVAAFEEEWLQANPINLPLLCNSFLGSDENCIVITAELNELPEVLEGTSQLALEALSLIHI